LRTACAVCIDRNVLALLRQVTGLCLAVTAVGRFTPHGSSRPTAVHAPRR
jgi:hypothetical protein